MDSHRINNMQDTFLVKDNSEMMQSFRKTTREYHVKKYHNTLMQGADLGCYSPKYDNILRKAPIVGINSAGDRFGPDSPFYIQPVEAASITLGPNSPFKR